MRIEKTFRHFLLNGQHIPSRAEFKRVILTGYLSVLCIVANLLYVLVATREGHYDLSWFNALFCLICGLTLWLIRLKRYTVAKFVLFLGAYLIIFVFCAIEPAATAVSFFFILINLAATALFGMDQWKYALVLTALGASLFVLVYVFHFKLTNQEFSIEYVHDNFVMNFFVILVLSVLIISFMLELNHHAEQSLEQKEKEALEKNKELTKLNAELDRFVYSVSHDLRSPLASISGLVHIGENAKTLEEAKQYFHMIGDRISAQDFFIREIISFYRNSRTETTVELFQLQALVTEILSEHEMNLGAIKCQIQITDDLKIQSDKIRIKSVLSNLIGNAIKYHDPNKTEQFILVSAVKQNGQATIAVEDNGQGIGPNHLPKVFDMFYRASTDSKGSGLGLFIVRETVEKLGGKIHVDSTLGSGSRFWFTLPTSHEG